MISRRRFLTILGASVLASPAKAAWQGRALGAEARLELSGAGAKEALHEVQAILTRTEALFSLHDPASALARLNRAGHLAPMPPEMASLFDLVDQVHDATRGAFDPTVQPVWRALAEGRPQKAPIGWQHVSREGQTIHLGQGQALTLNGIAQGWATDQVARCLRQRGFGDLLVEVGEFTALGGPFAVDIEDPAHGRLATRRLTDRAIATSSPRATLVRGAPHIIGPEGQPALWSTVSVEAPTATLADALSTAFCLMPTAAITAACAAIDQPIRVTLIDAAGNLSTL